MTDTLSRSGAWIFRTAAAGIVFCPEHAQLLAAAGFDRAEIRRFLAERCGKSVADLAAVGKDGLGERGVRHADGTRAAGFDPMLASADPEHLLIAVAGPMARVFLSSGTGHDADASTHDPAGPPHGR